MSLEHSAVLSNRSSESGISELEPQLRAKGWITFGAVAFATTYSPAQVDDRLLMEQLINVLWRDDASIVPSADFGMNASHQQQ